LKRSWFKIIKKMSDFIWIESGTIIIASIETVNAILMASIGTLTASRKTFFNQLKLIRRLINALNY
jgi:hypothetical protein